MEIKKKSLFSFISGLSTVLVFGLVSSIIQTSVGRVKITDLRDATNSSTITLKATDKEEASDYVVAGKVVSGLLYVPKTATKENPAPAVALTHGAINNREMQEAFAIELSRRGFVVLTVDREGHGYNTETAREDGTGGVLYNAAKYLYNLRNDKGEKIVDPTRIGVSGHSMGGMATYYTVSMDGVDTTYGGYTGQTDEALTKGYHLGIVSAYLGQSSSYVCSAKYGKNVIAAGNIFGSGEETSWGVTLKSPVYIGIAKDIMTVDSFANGVNGTYSGSVDGKIYVKKGNNYVAITSGDTYHKNKQYYCYNTKVDTTQATGSKWFLNSTAACGFVGIDTKTVTTEQYQVENGALYNKATGTVISGSVKNLTSVTNKGTQVASSAKSIRVLYQYKGTHPMCHFSCKAVSYATDFFYSAFGTPSNAKYIKATNEVWLSKEIFNVIGIAGLFLMLIGLVGLLLELKPFKSLQGKEVKREELPSVLNIRRVVTTLLTAIATTIYGWIAWKKIASTGGADSMLYKFIYNSTTFLGSGQTYTTYQNVSLYSLWGIKTAIFGLAFTAVMWLINHCITLIVHKNDPEKYEYNPFAGYRISSFGNAVKTVGVAAIVVIAFYFVIFILQKCLNMTFMIWTFEFRAFNLSNLLSYLRYVPFFIVYYIIVGPLNNAYRFKEIPEWLSILINIVFVIGGVTIGCIAYASHVGLTGTYLFKAASNRMFFVYPVILFLVFATVFSRIIYKKTNNAYLGGLILGIIATIMSCASVSMIGLL